MKKHTTNYIDTFIEVAEDCKVTEGCPPQDKEPKTAARIEYEMLVSSPYQHTSDDVLFESNGRRRGLDREDFFSKAQPCFRSSALCKTYGWGVHSDHDGKIALISMGAPQYLQLQNDENVKHVKAMRSSKK
jgi:hypothetical protein